MVPPEVPYLPLHYIYRLAQALAVAFMWRSNSTPWRRAAEEDAYGVTFRALKL
jgi:hypothetical protein